MKKLVLVSLLAAFVGFNAYSQFAFGVAPGLSTNTAYFGFKVGNVVPYVGFQYINVGFKMSYSGYYWDGAAVVHDEGDMKISGSLYVPDIGVKLFFIQQAKLKAYINVNVAKPLVRGHIKEDGDEVDDAIYHNGEWGPLNDLLKDVKVWGGQAGFGVEYFFDDNFSVGGEYGIMMLRGSFKEEWQELVWNGSADVMMDFEEKFSLKLMPTYARISLNFYFGGKGLASAD